MTSFGYDPVGDAVQRVLSSLDAGEGLPDRPERVHVDLKEEAGRRNRYGQVAPGERENERAAEQVAGEGACMANTEGSGALILGVANDGEVVGTSLDVDWLRARVFELTDRMLTIHVTEARVSGLRVLVIRPPQAVEAIRWHGRITWRVDDRCVEVDLATWHEQRMVRTHYDWSAQKSDVPATAVRGPALELVRRFLRDSGEPASADLANEPDQALLRRLDAVSNDGMLTNAAALLLRGREVPCLDYLHREVAGGDSTARVRLAERSLLEELDAVFAAVTAHNGIRHVPRGLVVGQVRDVPERAAREAVVNGVAHREWSSPDQTVVEHIGTTLRVTSPGGFYGGVTERNIITHPSRSRNRSLTELLRALRVAEREGIGVDRMVGDMVRLGHEPPSIREITGPFVRASLVADVRDEAWTTWLSELSPVSTTNDLNALLLLRFLVDHRWYDVQRVMPLLQLDELETRGALARAQTVTIEGRPVIVAVGGLPETGDPSFCLSREASARLSTLDEQVERPRAAPTRRAIALGYARVRGRISSTELASITQSQRPNVSAVLKELEDEGMLRAAFPSGRGRGFHYLWAQAPTADASIMEDER
ncbi:ATP-binding protein [uncultured Friedmanniella sp.]|uniref:ATP-binding protein n=1 Tax=uncultured Friedmanniella sp. TaxID=335381 RepID=UPI0035C9DF68